METAGLLFVYDSTQLEGRFVIEDIEQRQYASQRFFQLWKACCG